MNPKVSTIAFFMRSNVYTQLLQSMTDYSHPTAKYSNYSFEFPLPTFGFLFTKLPIGLCKYSFLVDKQQSLLLSRSIPLLFFSQLFCVTKNKNSTLSIHICLLIIKFGFTFCLTCPLLIHTFTMRQRKRNNGIYLLLMWLFGLDTL